MITNYVMSEYNSEYSAKKYYIHSSYVPSYYYLYIFIEKWVASNVFRNDLSRIFMASNDYAFRRRFELTDMSQDYSTIDASSLRFPFGNYWGQNTGWVADDRVAANTAAQVYQGMYLGTTKINAAAVKANIPIQLYFDREDDARLAYDRLFFYSFNKHTYSTTVPIANNTVGIPIVLQLNDITFNPTFNESDWLQKNRIFVISFTMEMSTYIVNPPYQPDYTFDDSDLSKYDDGNEQYYIVNDVILNFWNKASNIDVKTYCGTEMFPSEGEVGVYYVDSETPEELRGYDNAPVTRCPKIYRWDANENTYAEVNIHSIVDIDVASIGVDGSIARGSVDVTMLRVEATTTDSATISWNYADDYDMSNVYRITISTDDMKTQTDIDVTQKRFVLSNLEQGRHYIAILCFYDKDGSCKKLYVEFATKADSSVDKKKTLPTESLIGLKWDLE